MEFCTKKFRSFLIVKGISLNTTPFSVSKPTDSTDFSSFILPSIHSEPIRFLGRIIDGSISDRKAIDELENKLLDGLTILDKSCFRGPQKLWNMKHLLIPRIQWSLLMYEVPISVVVRLEQKTSSL